MILNQSLGNGDTYKVGTATCTIANGGVPSFTVNGTPKMAMVVKTNKRDSGAYQDQYSGGFTISAYDNNGTVLTAQCQNLGASYSYYDVTSVGSGSRTISNGQYSVNPARYFPWIKGVYTLLYVYK